MDAGRLLVLAEEVTVYLASSNAAAANVDLSVIAELANLENHIVDQLHVLYDSASALEHPVLLERLMRMQRQYTNACPTLSSMD
ncbi:hypothetical protein HK405_008489 [Cladochytrium tenue]|nr:hypothetical protein HK405_008489 [Cladochytrium tenue]